MRPGGKRPAGYDDLPGADADPVVAATAGSGSDFDSAGGSGDKPGCSCPVRAGVGVLVDAIAGAGSRWIAGSGSIEAGFGLGSAAVVAGAGVFADFRGGGARPASTGTTMLCPHDKQASFFPLIESSTQWIWPHLRQPNVSSMARSPNLPTASRQTKLSIARPPRLVQTPVRRRRRELSAGPDETLAET